ncbi:hypothetical protein SLA2020_490610 [Shorea laevis]
MVLAFHLKELNGIIEWWKKLDLQQSCQPLIKCIERWDISAIDQFSEYTKLVYQALLNIYSDMEAEVAKEGRSYAMDYAKELTKQTIKAHFHEAKWHQEGYVPPMEEYRQVAFISTGYAMLITSSFVGMGKVATKKAFD